MALLSLLMLPLDPDEPLGPSSRTLLVELLTQLEAQGVLHCAQAPEAVAAALHAGLRHLGAAWAEDATAAALLTLRAVGWAPTTRQTPDVQQAVLQAAGFLGEAFAREDVEHVADYMRYVEAEALGQPRRPVEAVLAEAARAQSLFRQRYGPLGAT